MWKKVLLAGLVVGLAVAIAKKIKDANDERELWHEATADLDLH
jgi:hypothetical protein